MSRKAGAPQDDQDQMVLFLLIFIGGWFAFQFLYGYFKVYINPLIIWIKTFEAIPLAYLVPDLKKGLQEIHQYNFTTFEPHHLAEISYFIGRYTRWMFAISLLLLALWIYFGFGYENYRRKMNMKKLLSHNVEHYACMAPVLNLDLLNEPYDDGPWRLAETPLEFAINNQLLLNKEDTPYPKKDIFRSTGMPNEKSKALAANGNYLDKDKASEIFVQQLGVPFSSQEPFSELNAYEKGLAAAFVAHGCGDKDAAFDLLDRMSRSFIQGNFENYTLDNSGATELWVKYKDDEFLQDDIETHSIWKGTWFMSLLIFARNKGVLPCQEFIWLRPIDRLLWYTLNQVGGRTAWSEAAGPWSHFHVERVLGKPMFEPEVDNAVTGLEFEMIQEGWIGSSDGA